MNNVSLMGRLVADPVVRVTSNDVTVANFTLAIDRGYGDDKTADFIDVVAWRATAEFVANWFRKGMRVAVSGSIQTRVWEADDGSRRKSVEVVAREVFFADSPRDQPFDGKKPRGSKGNIRKR